jgi:hypothetical protein
MLAIIENNAIPRRLGDRHIALLVYANKHILNALHRQTRMHINIIAAKSDLGSKDLPTPIRSHTAA